MRVAKACLQCRAAKRKCRLPQDEGPCTQCRQKDYPCSLTTGRTTSRPLSSHALAPAPQDDLFPLELRVQLVDLYLDFLHGKPHTLFHPEELRRAVRERRVPHHVLFSIAGLGCRFSESNEVRSRKHCFMESAKANLKLHIDDFGLDTLQACVLVGNLYGAEGDSSIESLFFALAFRIAHIIKLPKPDPQDDEIIREEKIRAWWSLYMIDGWSSAGLNVPRQIPDGQAIPFPRDEIEFYAMERKGPVHARRPGLWAQMVRLTRVFNKIQDLHKQHAGGDLDLHQVEMLTGKYWNDLDAFSRDLPSEYHLTEQNLLRHAKRGVGRDFVALHLGFYHYATLLFFPYLDIELESSQVQRIYAARCKEHAAALSDLLTLSNSIEGCRAVYFIVAHMTTVSSSALLHDLLFGDEETLRVTRQRLEANFQVLIYLRDIWPAANMLTYRLFTFQNMCLRSADPNTHRADNWMVKFLLQHAFPIDAKIAPSETPAALVNGIDRGKYASDALSILRT